MTGAELSTWSVLPAQGTLRTPPRPVDMRQPGYDDSFDNTTLLYDVFKDFTNRKVVAIGPPLHNFFAQFEQIHLTDGTNRLDKALVVRDRNMQIWIDGATDVEEISFWHEKLTSPRLKVNANRCHLFAGKRVIVTLSKDNSLTWIADWARFYHMCHGADGVLLYDNGSTLYELDDIRAAIAAVSPAITVEIVPWPFKFGARGGPHSRWDSDYCQYGALEHARHKYLREAASVLSCDIDELVVSTTGRSIFEATETKRRGYTVIGGMVMPNNFDPASPNERRFTDYLYCEPKSRCPNKWCVVPAKPAITQQWKVHGVTGFSTQPDKEEFAYRHFRGINTNWTFDRTKPEPILSKHALDTHWVTAMEKAFGKAAAPASRPAEPRVGTQPARSAKG